MKQIKVLYYRIFRPSIMDTCLQSAYEDIHFLIKDVFTNLGQHGLKLTYGEFVSLFEKYDWIDIIDALENLEHTPTITNNSLFNELDVLISVTVNEIINSQWNNSYFIEFISNQSF